MQVADLWLNVTIRTMLHRSAEVCCCGMHRICRRKIYRRISAKTHKSADASFRQAGSFKVWTDDTQVRRHEVKLHGRIALYFLHVFCVWMMKCNTQRHDYHLWNLALCIHSTDQVSEWNHPCEGQIWIKNRNLFWKLNAMWPLGTLWNAFVCTCVISDLLTELVSSWNLLPSSPGDRKPGDTRMSDRRRRGEMAPKTGGR